MGSLSPKVKQVIAKTILQLSAGIAVAVLLGIVGYVVVKGIKVIDAEFLFGKPRSMGREGGIFPFIISSIYITVISLLVSVPLGLGSAIYLTEYTRETWATKVIRFGVDCLAGVPSIVLGLFGFTFFVRFLNFSWSILSGGLTVSLMILPFILRSSEEAIRTVPKDFREVAFAVGATKWQCVTRVVLPCALPGIVTGVILSIGKCVGETASLIFTAGTSLRVPLSVFDSGRTLAIHFYLLVRETGANDMAYGSAAVLLISILVINFFAYWLMRRYIARVS
ncbi:MAG: phosphate ABC transporter, permease protein PstA [Planctomycetes bacterium RBG_16_55_9]|nr:MAG: phosphate ABC transporter, permease protein PstA [Planctomycetes bacterium RBG_16_55_9]